MLQILMQLLPMLLPLLKKNGTQRNDAIQLGVNIQRAAETTGDWKGILTGGLFQRIGRMSEEDQEALGSAIEGAIAAHAAHMAKEAKD